MKRYYRYGMHKGGTNKPSSLTRFKSKDAYDKHVNSEHVQNWAKKYISSGLFNEKSFTFLNMDKDGAGGFDRL